MGLKVVVVMDLGVGFYPDEIQYANEIIILFEDVYNATADDTGFDNGFIVGIMMADSGLL